MYLVAFAIGLALGHWCGRAYGQEEVRAAQREQERKEQAYTDALWREVSIGIDRLRELRPELN